MHGVKWDKTSSKAGVKILNESLSETDQLAILYENLQSLLLAAEQGEWDRISDLSEQFLPALDAAKKTDFLSNIASINRREIQNLLTMLQSAIEQCSIRKNQIAPLIKAFVIAKDATETP